MVDELENVIVSLYAKGMNHQSNRKS